MFTIYSTCKPFTDPKFNIIQRNAIKSWLKITPKPEIILFGKDAGTKEICEEFSLKHISEVQCSEQGTPRLDDMMNQVESLSNSEMFLLISSDVLLFQNSLDAARACKAKFDNFCASIKRYDIIIDSELDFEEGWDQKVLSESWWGHPWCGDFFLYTRGFFGQIPPFFVGRSGVDSWLYKKAIDLGFLIHITENVAQIVHQNHEPDQIGNRFKSQEEFALNAKLAGDHISSISAANWFLLKDQMVSKNQFTSMIFSYFESKQNDNNNNVLPKE